MEDFEETKDLFGGIISLSPAKKQQEKRYSFICEVILMEFTLTLVFTAPLQHWQESKKRKEKYTLNVLLLYLCALNNRNTFAFCISLDILFEVRLNYSEVF